MPGIHLNDTERKLQKLWEKREEHLYLQSVSVKTREGGVPLRGIRNLSVNFRYPITALYGKNGSGKSTILALCGLAFHGDGKHIPLVNRITPSKQPSKNLIFGDFFISGSLEKSPKDIEIEWEYTNSHDNIHIEKTTNRWMRYERRPHKAVSYLGIQRVLPATEIRALQRQFKTAKVKFKSQPLNDQYKQYLSQIMGLPYEQASTLINGNSEIRACSTDVGDRYTSFNMGAGEDVIIEVLYTLQEAPEESLLAIEEIEMGIHPSALKELISIMKTVALKKKLQIIMTTHSATVIDALPREARILLLKDKEQHISLYNLSTRTSLYHLADESHKELRIICEDEIAESIIEASLPSELRNAVELFGVGGDSTLVPYAKYSKKFDPEVNVFIIWDGDVKKAEIKNWFRKQSCEGDFLYMLIPHTPNQNPEEYLLDCISHDSSIEKFRDEFDIETQAKATEIMNKLKTLANKHNIFLTLSRTCSITKAQAIKSFVRLAKENNNEIFEKIKNAIKLLLTGQCNQSEIDRIVGR